MKSYKNLKHRLNASHLYCFSPGKFAKGRDIIEIIKQEIYGGADIIQLREKELSDREKLQLALKIREITKKNNVLFIVNDDIDIAYFSDADGVHLGQNDIPPEFARKLLKNKIIGISTHNLKQFITAQNLDVDYVAIGPIFKTFTKENPDPVIGLKNLKEILKYKKSKIIGIGGIKYSNLKKVISCGIDCLAILSGIVDTNNIKKTTEKYKKKIIYYVSQYKNVAF